MNFRKYMLLIVGGGICLILAALALYLLLRFQSDYTRVDESLGNAMNQLSVLNYRDPYPSEENVKRLQQNLGGLREHFMALYSNLRQGQMEPRRMEPAEFPGVLGRARNQLAGKAAELNVKLPERFAFGFDRYVGELPAAVDIPRLVIQTKEVEELCMALYRAKVSEISSIQRTIFEQAALVEAASSAEGRRGGRRREGGEESPEGVVIPAVQTQDPNALYTREHYVLSFTATDSSVWELLNILARLPMFVVVTDIQMTSENKDLNRGVLAKNAAATAAAQAAAAAQPNALGLPPPAPVIVSETNYPPREERVVAGRERMQVVLGVDVYRFTRAAQKEEAKL